VNRAFFHHRLAGFTLIELLIGLLLGVLVAAAATTVFMMNSRTREATDSLGRMQEGARVAFELMARDLRQTGGFGCGREAGIGDSGSRMQGLDYAVSNALANADGTWWASWNQALPTGPRGGLRGYGASQAFGDAPFATATASRLADTAAIEIRYAHPRVLDGTFVAPANPASDPARIQLNVPATGINGHGFVSGDLVFVCAQSLAPVGSGVPPVENQDLRDFRPWAVLAQVAVIGPQLELAYAGLLPGNRIPALWAPAPIWAPATRAQPRVLVSRYVPVRWYVGTNARGGRSLFRETITAGDNPQALREEIVEGVSNLRFEYALDGGLDFVAAPVADWADVTAVRVTVRVESGQGGPGTEGARVGEGNTTLQREFTSVVALRSRLP